MFKKVTNVIEIKLVCVKQLNNTTKTFVIKKLTFFTDLYAISE